MSLGLISQKKLFLECHSRATWECIQDIPESILLIIFRYLDLNNCVVCTKVCKLWNNVIRDRITAFGRFKSEISGIQSIAQQKLFASKEINPSSWFTPHNTRLQFTYVKDYEVGFAPNLGMQESKFISLQSSEEIFKNLIFLGCDENFLYLTTSNNKAYPLGYYILEQDNLTLQVYCKETSYEKYCEISLSELSRSLNKNASDFLIQNCIPIKRDQIAIVSRNYLTFWEIAKGSSVLKKIFDFSSEKVIGHIGNFLLLNSNKMIDLATQEQKVCSLEFDTTTPVKTCGSDLCLFDTKKSRIHYYTLSEKAEFCEKWHFDLQTETANEEMKFQILSINQNYLLLSYIYKGDYILNVLDKSGNEVLHLSLGYFPEFPQTHGEILLFKNPDTSDLYFWHLLLKKVIFHFSCHDLLKKDNFASQTYSSIHDVRYENGFLYFLVKFRDLLDIVGCRVIGSCKAFCFKIDEEPRLCEKE